MSDQDRPIDAGTLQKSEVKSDAVKHEDELIKHLSGEIRSLSSYITTFRSRMAFTILIGPFLVLGSFLALARDKPSLQVKFTGSVFSYIAVGGACVAYLLLGVYGAAIDNYATKKCNDWRRLIVYLSRNKSTNESLRIEKCDESTDELIKMIITEEPARTKYSAYFFGLLLVLIIFLCVAYLLFH